jgi:hypothetical protein
MIIYTVDSSLSLSSSFFKNFLFLFLFFLFKMFLIVIFVLFLKGISPDVVTYSTLMKAYIRSKKFDRVRTLCPSVTSN